MAAAVIMAAGKGTRMQSDLPKVLLPVLGRPMIEYVLDAVSTAGVDRVVVVVGYRAELVQETLAGRPNVQFVLQAEQLGTGHAVKVCRDALSDYEGPVVVVAGDSPMLLADSLRTLLGTFAETQPACLLGTARKPDPTGYGRIVRDAEGRFVGVVEQKDATPEQQKIDEVNLSTYVFDRGELFWALDRLQNANNQREYYLTDCPALLLAAGRRVDALPVLQPREALSVNTLQELASVEAVMRHERSQDL
ncbi:MAG TPA: NTP transferase domain-containing protein [Pirellulales bacterium]